MDNCSEVDGQSFDGQLQRSVGKADSGMANVREGSPAPGRLSARGRVLPAGVLFHRDDLDGCELRSSRFGPAGLAAVQQGSANELSRLRLTGADPNDRRCTGRITVGGSEGPKC